MGEVYRARDSRLQRDVAIKVLPRALAQDQDRLRRFEREARAAGQLNHPNIMAVYDIGSTDGATTGVAATGGAGTTPGLPYIVCELLEGATLRSRLATGPIPPRKAIQYATQVARGLAAAHAKGIAHRDLKPENLVILAGDHVKILDFGLAKLLRPDADGSASAPDDDTGSIAVSLTVTGAILGTPSYMSPEQVRDQPSDHRTDIFALGAILYEMLTGRRAFDGPSHADRMTAILTSEPPPLPTEIENAAPGLNALIAHTLEKSPGDRFDTASDLAFALSLVLGRSAARPQSAAGAKDTAHTPALAPLTYRRITFRDGAVFGARFAPDGQAIFYGAAWDGRPTELFWSYPGNPEARALGHVKTDLLSIAVTGEMAISRGRTSRGGFVQTGMLARMPMGGGAPKDIMGDVQEAEFHPDSRRLAVVRDEAGMTRIEFPAGKVLYQTPGWPSSVRFSPDGTRIAFLDHPARGNDGGSVAVVDVSGDLKRLSSGWSSLRGLAWSPDGREVLFGGFRDEVGRAIHAVALDGAARRLFQIPGNMTLADVSRQGAMLVVLDNERMRGRFAPAGEKESRDLTWLDWTLFRAITPDGSRVLFDETGVAGGDVGSAYIRDTDGSSAVRLGDGIALSLSRDGQWVLANVGLETARLEVLPVGVGEPRTIPTPGLEFYHAAWFPDGSVCCLGREPGHGPRLFKIDPATGKREPFSEEGLSYFEQLVSPDGRFVAAHGPDQKVWIYPVDGGAPVPVKGAREFERMMDWSEDGSAVFTYSRGELPAKVWRIDLKTGERTLWREISPPDRTGVMGVASVRMTSDAATFAYSYYQRLSTLCVVEGLF
jgi:Tol biopolymer transport system component